ncbi:hypothetical protein LXL04_004469 [Taraxacum kok-saghyz]
MNLFWKNGHGSSSSGSLLHYQRTGMLILLILRLLRRHQPPSPPASFLVRLLCSRRSSAVAAPQHPSAVAPEYLLAAMAMFCVDEGRKEEKQSSPVFPAAPHSVALHERVTSPSRKKPCRRVIGFASRFMHMNLNLAELLPPVSALDSSYLIKLSYQELQISPPFIVIIIINYYSYYYMQFLIIKYP